MNSNHSKDPFALEQRGDVQPTVGEDFLTAGHALQQVRSSYATAVAVQKPRELAKVKNRLLEEARLAGESAYYGWGAGDNQIEGPSTALAHAAARCWGNCAVETLPVQDLQDSWIFTAAFIDLETGFTLTRQFRQSKKWTVHGKLDAERKDDVRFQIGQSKATRNVILNALPRSLIDSAVEEAKKGVRNKIAVFIEKNGLAAAVDAMLSALAKEGVKEDQVLERFGLAGKAALDLEHLVILRGDLSSIQSGGERAETLFPHGKAGETGTQGPPAGRHTVGKTSPERQPEKPAQKEPEQAAASPEPPKQEPAPAASGEPQASGETPPAQQSGTPETWSPEEAKKFAHEIELYIAEATTPNILADTAGDMIVMNQQKMGPELTEALKAKYRAKFEKLTKRKPDNQKGLPLS